MEERSQRRRNGEDNHELLQTVARPPRYARREQSSIRVFSVRPSMFGSRVKPPIFSSVLSADLESQLPPKQAPHT
jgi:hypothetical protein